MYFMHLPFNKDHMTFDAHTKGPRYKNTLNLSGKPVRMRKHCNRIARSWKLAKKKTYLFTHSGAYWSYQDYIKLDGLEGTQTHARYWVWCHTQSKFSGNHRWMGEWMKDSKETRKYCTSGTMCLDGTYCLDEPVGRPEFNLSSFCLGSGDVCLHSISQ